MVAAEIKIEGNGLLLSDDADGLTVANTDVRIGNYLGVNSDVFGEAIGCMREVKLEIDDIGVVRTSNCV